MIIHQYKNHVVRMLTHRGNRKLAFAVYRNGEAIARSPFAYTDEKTVQEAGEYWVDCSLLWRK